MNIIGVTDLRIPDVKVIRIGRFRDHRGHFTEQFRKSDIQRHAPFFGGADFVQANENFSRAGTIRGLHFQWNPFMGKLARTVTGRMVDLALDVRHGSPTYGKILAYDMPATQQEDYAEWIWVPPGFAHGNLFPEDSVVEYWCTGEHSPDYQGAISPLAGDIDWSLCELPLWRLFETVVSDSPLISDKDRGAMSVESWTRDPRSRIFSYNELSSVDLESSAAA